MCICLLFFFLFLLVCIFFLSAYTNGDKTNQHNRSVNIFVPETIRTRAFHSDNVYCITPNNFYSYSFILNDGAIVIFAVASYFKENAENTCVLAKYFKIKNGYDWIKKAVDYNSRYKDLEANMVIESRKYIKKRYTVHENFDGVFKNIMTVVVGKEIFFLVLRHKMLTEDIDASVSYYWEPVFLAGHVANNKNNNNNIDISFTLKPNLLFSLFLRHQFMVYSINVTAYHGYSFVTADSKKVVFVFTPTEENGGGFLLIHSNDINIKREWELSYVPSFDACYYPFLFMWKEKLIMASTYCENGDNNVRESTDMGKTWNDSNEPFSYLWDYMIHIKDAAIAIIENTTVLLFTQVKYKVNGNELQKDIYLWMTNGNRLCDVGIIVADVKDDTSTDSIVYAEDELLFLHQQLRNAEVKNIVLTRLKEQLETIQFVLKKWNEMDTYFVQSYNVTPTHGTNLTPSSFTAIPTDGLVGFLSGNNNNNGEWSDEYLYVDAVVKGGKRVPGGFKFNDFGAGAKWPVGTQRRTLFYNFERHGFTAVATVKIEKVPEKKEIPLLTVGGVSVNSRLGLWYTRYRHWKVMARRIYASTGGEYWQENKTYCVFLILRKNLLTAYVDGVPVGGSLSIPVREKRLVSIQSIFIGGYQEDSGGNDFDAISHVNVANVLLYNRPLNNTEIAAVVKRRMEEFTSTNIAGEAQTPQTSENRHLSEGSFLAYFNYGTTDIIASLNILPSMFAFLLSLFTLLL